MYETIIKAHKRFLQERFEKYGSSFLIEELSNLPPHFLPFLVLVVESKAARCTIVPYC